jgi:hypothetical protein
LSTLLRDPRLVRTSFIMETPGVDEGYDAINVRRARLLYDGVTELPILPPRAFKLNRRGVRGQAPSRAASAAGRLER